MGINPGDVSGSDMFALQQFIQHHMLLTRCCFNWVRKNNIIVQRDF